MVENWAGHLFQTPMAHEPALCQKCPQIHMSISGLVVEYIVASDVTRVRFLADALSVDALANSVMTHWCQHNLMAQGLK